MPEKSVVNIEIALKKGCRACLIQKPNQQTVFYEDMEVNVADMLRECASIIVDQGDGLPTGICTECIETLKIAYNFKLQCQKTDDTLKEYLQQKNEKKEEELRRIAEENSKRNIKKEIINTKRKRRSKKGSLIIKNKDSCTNNENTEKRILYDCAKCSKSFIRFSNLKIHLKAHGMTRNIFSDSKKYGCDKCSMFFASTERREAHIRAVHKSHSCKLCDKKFRSSRAVSYHVATYHNGQKPFSCTHPGCLKRFGGKSVLDKHMALHTDVKEYLCNICGKAYARYDSWHYHMKQHNGSRSHLCTYCGKTFIQSCHLKTHMWVHTGVKPHICSSCGNSYTTGHQLKKHWRRHCGKTTTQVETTETTMKEMKEEDTDVL